jgi:hypothetical protein
MAEHAETGCEGSHKRGDVGFEDGQHAINLDAVQIMPCRFCFFQRATKLTLKHNNYDTLFRCHAQVRAQLLFTVPW